MASIKVNFNLVHGSQGLRDHVQSIAGKLRSSTTSLKEVQQLTHELDVACTSLNAMKTKTSSIFSQTDIFGGIEETIQALYGELNDATIRKEVLQIQQETGSLNDAMKAGNASLQAVDALEKHLSKITRDHCLLSPDLRVIAEARRTLQRASSSIQGSSSTETVMNHFEWLAQQEPVHVILDDLEEGEFEAILDVAALVYDGKIREAISSFHRLAGSHQERIKRHMGVLGKELFHDRLATLQALVATVNELVGNGELYPSYELIEELFTGLKELTDSRACLTGSIR